MQIPPLCQANHLVHVFSDSLRLDLNDTPIVRVSCTFRRASEGHTALRKLGDGRSECASLLAVAHLRGADLAVSEHFCRETANESLALI